VFDLSDGTLLSYKSSLHSRNITAIMFFSALKYLVTAAKDGTSKLCFVCITALNQWFIICSLWALYLVYEGLSRGQVCSGKCDICCRFCRVFI